MTREDFIEKAIVVHGRSYDYSPTIYLKATEKIIINCPQHGDFSQVATEHLRGRGCQSCGKAKININNGRKFTQEKFIEKVQNIKGLTFEKSIYKNRREKVIVTCKVHGDYNTTPDALFKGAGCRRCESLIKNLKTQEEFLEDATNVHKGLYDYSKVEYKGSFNKVIIKCKKHSYFQQAPFTHLKGSGCPKCKNSKGELFISEWLDNNNIVYLTQKTFAGCKDIRRLKFDFFIPSLNLCIEFDGEQHFRAISNGFWGGQKGLEQRLKRDRIKTQYCVDNSIKLLRVRYDDNIVEKLESLSTL